MCDIEEKRNPPEGEDDSSDATSEVGAVLEDKAKDKEETHASKGPQ